MFKRSRAEQAKETALSASALALELAHDPKFRKRLLSAIRHSSEAGRRTRDSLGAAAAFRRVAADQALRAELRQARDDLQQAYARLDANRRSHRLRRLALAAAIASLAAVPRVRKAVSAAVVKLAEEGEHLRDLAGTEQSSHSAADPTQSGSLGDLTGDEQYARAKDADIPGREEMSKEELAAELRARG